MGEPEAGTLETAVPASRHSHAPSARGASPVLLVQCASSSAAKPETAEAMRLAGTASPHLLRIPLSQLMGSVPNKSKRALTFSRGICFHTGMQFKRFSLAGRQSVVAGTLASMFASLLSGVLSAHGATNVLERRDLPSRTHCTWEGGGTISPDGRLKSCGLFIDERYAYLQWDENGKIVSRPMNEGKEK
jgi:hypothetical protein